MKFPSIRIEGSIFSSDILEKIEQGDISGQLPKDVGFDTNIKVKDEIAIAWEDANSFWKVFKSRTDILKVGDSGLPKQENTGRERSAIQILKMQKRVLTIMIISVSKVIPEVI